MTNVFYYTRAHAIHQWVNGVTYPSDIMYAEVTGVASPEDALGYVAPGYRFSRQIRDVLVFIKVAPSAPAVTCNACLGQKEPV